MVADKGVGKDCEWTGLLSKMVPVQCSPYCRHIGKDQISVWCLQGSELGPDKSCLCVCVCLCVRCVSVCVCVSVCLCVICVCVCVCLCVICVRNMCVCVSVCNM